MPTPQVSAVWWRQRGLQLGNGHPETIKSTLSNLRSREARARFCCSVQARRCLIGAKASFRLRCVTLEDASASQSGSKTAARNGGQLPARITIATARQPYSPRARPRPTLARATANQGALPSTFIAGRCRYGLLTGISLGDSAPASSGTRRPGTARPFRKMVTVFRQLR